MARVTPVILEVETVVEGDLFAGANVTSGNDPDIPRLENRLAIGLTAMVDETRRVPWNIAVKVMLMVQAEDVLVIALAASKGFLLVDPLADVLDDPSPPAEAPRGKCAGAVDAGVPDRNVLRAGDGF